MTVWQIFIVLVRKCDVIT